VNDIFSNNFEMNDFEVTNVILNIKLPREDIGGITFLQPHYVGKVLGHFGYSDCKRTPTPYDPSELLRKNP